MNELYDFWFSEDSKPHWWQQSDDYDALLKSRFGDIPDAVRGGQYDHMKDTPEGLVTLIISVDQLPRNLFRGSAQAFAYDALARQLTERMLEKGWDQALESDARIFAYMPLEHSENLDDQKRCVALFKTFVNEDLLKFAQLHHDIVAQFGRFPHRNDVLNRQSTLEELEWLKTGHRFGQ